MAVPSHPLCTREVNMATPKFSVGDLVSHVNEIFVITSIRSLLNFNLYKILNTNDGSTKEVPSTELHEVSSASGGSRPSLFEPEESSEVEDDRTRFHKVTTGELDELALNASSKRTKDATKWGIALFKGK